MFDKFQLLHADYFQNKQLSNDFGNQQLSNDFGEKTII